MEKVVKRYKKDFSNFEEQNRKIRRLWNMKKKAAELLYFFVISKNPKNILEIGTSNGFSTFWLSLAAEKTNAKVYTIEVDENRYQLAQKNLKNRNNIIMYNDLAENVIPSISSNFDFVFIDAGKIGYISYIKLLIPKLEKQALIIADNVCSHAETVKDYIHFVRNHSQFVTMELPIEDGLEITIYKP